LEEDLVDAYGRMSEPERRRFKTKVSASPRDRFDDRSVQGQAVKVLKLLTGWLKLIPGANRFFVVQEASSRPTAFWPLPRRRSPSGRSSEAMPPLAVNPTRSAI